MSSNVMPLYAQSEQYVREVLPISDLAFSEKDSPSEVRLLSPACTETC
jgi:hypothetical protein